MSIMMWTFLALYPALVFLTLYLVDVDPRTRRRRQAQLIFFADEPDTQHRRHERRNRLSDVA